MEEMTRLFGLDFQLLHDVVLMALAVFFLFLFMSKMLFEPARKLLNDRKNRIAADIKTAETDKQDAAALKAEYDAKLKEVDKEAEQILSEARKTAQKNAARIESDAKEEAARIIKRANEEAELSKKRKTGNGHSCIHDGGKSCCSKYRCDRAGYAGRRNIERNG